MGGSPGNTLRKFDFYSEFYGKDTMTDLFYRSILYFEKSNWTQTNRDTWFITKIACRTVQGVGEMASLSINAAMSIE